MSARKWMFQVREVRNGVFQVKLSSKQLAKVTASAQRRGVTPLEVFEHAVGRAMQGSYPGLVLGGRQLQRTVRQLLKKFRGNVSAVARAMNKDRTQIRRWMRRYRLSRKRF